MKKFHSNENAVIDLHDRGYNEDFQLTGNDLLWLQKKIYLRTGEFSILEYHRIFYPGNKKSETIVLGVLAVSHDTRGILIIHYNSSPAKLPPVIMKKINELKSYVKPENLENILGNIN